MLYQFTFSPNVWEFQFLRIFNDTYFLIIVILTSVIPHVIWICTSLIIIDVLKFHIPVGYLPSLEKYLFISPFYNQTVIILLLSCRSSLIYFGYLPHIRYLACRYLLPFWRLSFYSADSLLHRGILVWCILTTYFDFCFLGFWCHLHEITAKTSVKKLLPYAFSLVFHSVGSYI